MEKKYVRSSNRKHHIVYKTTCSITGRFYIGLHSTDKLDDGYLGSGKRLRRSILKHGAENHSREILFELATRELASDKEKELITSELLKNPDCLNCGVGGLGATDRPATSEETKAKLSAASKKYVRTKEWYEKAVATRRANGGFGHTPESIAKIVAGNTGKKLTDAHKLKISKGGTGLKRSAETCENISKALTGKIVQRPPMSEAHKEAIRLSRIGKKHSEEAKANMRRSKDQSKQKKRCTIDGITIFESVGDLIKTLGSGKTGGRSPNFTLLQ